MTNQEKEIHKLLKAALKKLKIRRATAAVFLVKSKELKRLKAMYYKGKRASRKADVLSFPEPRGFPHPESRKKFLGEIYLNEGLKSDPEQLRFLLTHGLLHLLGFTHDGKNDTLKMQALEKKLLGKVSR